MSFKFLVQFEFGKITYLFVSTISRFAVVDNCFFTCSSCYLKKIWRPTLLFVIVNSSNLLIILSLKTKFKRHLPGEFHDFCECFGLGTATTLPHQLLPSVSEINRGIFITRSVLQVMNSEIEAFAI